MRNVCTSGAAHSKNMGSGINPDILDTLGNPDYIAKVKKTCASLRGRCSVTPFVA